MASVSLPMLMKFKFTKNLDSSDFWLKIHSDLSSFTGVGGNTGPSGRPGIISGKKTRSSKSLFPNVRVTLNYFLPITLSTLFHFYSFHSGFWLLLYSGSRNPDNVVVLLDGKCIGWSSASKVQFGLEVLNRIKIQRHKIK